MLCLSPALLLLNEVCMNIFCVINNQLEAILTLLIIPLCGKLKTIEHAESQREITKGQSEKLNSM